MIKKILLGLDGTLLFLCVLVGIDYSYYVAGVKYVNDTQTVILSDTLSLKTDNKEINFENKKPQETMDVYFKVENMVNKETTFNILLNNIINNYGKDLIYELYEGEKLVVSKTIAPQNNGNSYIKLNVNIAGGETKNYNLKFTLLNKNNKPEEEYTNKGFKANLNINSLSINNEIKTATNYIIASNTILTENDANGLAKLDNNYYFKGNVINNYVKINNELWRIIKIDTNGNIKIIKDENIGASYQYKTDGKQENANNYLTSNVINELNNYYNNNLKEYESLIAESNYCVTSNAVKNDSYKINENSINYTAYSPSIKCNDQNNLKIGLISYDEARLAGLNYTSSYLNDNYLVNGNNKNTWTLSPAGVFSYNNENYVWIISNRKTVIEDKVVNNNSIRPVINIKGTLNLEGEGTIDNPYIFSE